MTEIQELKNDYDSGKFEHIRLDLVAFIHNNKEKIVQFRDRISGTRKEPLANHVALKMYIMQIRSINPADEIKSQLKEIEREIWIRGEELGRAPDRSVVAREWCKRHAPGWRDHRVLEIIYVVERNREDLANLLA